MKQTLVKQGMDRKQDNSHLERPDHTLTNFQAQWKPKTANSTELYIYTMFFPVHKYICHCLFYKLGKIREYQSCQHHCLGTLGPVLSKITVT